MDPGDAVVRSDKMRWRSAHSLGESFSGGAIALLHALSSCEFTATTLMQSLQCFGQYLCEHLFDLEWLVDIAKSVRVRAW